jgi:flagellar FliL protein
MKLIIILAVVVLLAGGGIGGWLVLSSGDDSAAPVAGKEKTEPETALGLIFNMETFVVNLNDPGGKRYLKTKIDLEYTRVELAEELTQRLPQLRDVILLLLSNKSLDEIQGVEGKIALRRELIMRINQVLKGGKIRNLYFTQFVIQ